MKILVLDIETSPNVAHTWGLFNQNVGLKQLLEPQRMLSFAAMWGDETNVMFYSEFHHGHENMVRKAHSLLEEADVVVTYNGRSFDVPHLMREFVLLGLEPPAPFSQVDLYRVVRKNFRFASNKLDHVASQLGLGHKLEHPGHALWVSCLEGDPKAWNLMRKYNKQDVVLTADLYRKLLPWVGSHPNVILLDGGDYAGCSRCGSTQLQKRGTAVTATGRYQRFQCQSCGGWSRLTKRDAGVPVVAVS